MNKAHLKIFRNWCIASAVFFLSMGCEKEDSTTFGPAEGPYDHKTVAIKLIDSADPARLKRITFEVLKIKLNIIGTEVISPSNKTYQTDAVVGAAVFDNFSRKTIDKSNPPTWTDQCPDYVADYTWLYDSIGPLSKNLGAISPDDFSVDFEAQYADGIYIKKASGKVKAVEILESAPVQEFIEYSSSVVSHRLEDDDDSGVDCYTDFTETKKIKVKVNKDVKVILTLDLADFD